MLETRVGSHELKVLPKYFKPLVKGYKTFEIRKLDRDFRVGDLLILKEWDGQQYTGMYINKYISYILRDAPQYGLMEGYCILGLKNSRVPMVTLD